MAKKSTGTVTLSMTLEEADFVFLTLAGKVSDLKEDIDVGDRIPESDICVAAAQKARERLPMAEALVSRVLRASVNANLGIHQGGGRDSG